MAARYRIEEVRLNCTLYFVIAGISDRSMGIGIWPPWCGWEISRLDWAILSLKLCWNLFLQWDEKQENSTGSVRRTLIVSVTKRCQIVLVQKLGIDASSCLVLMSALCIVYTSWLSMTTYSTQPHVWAANLLDSLFLLLAKNKINSIIFTYSLRKFS